MRGALLNQVRVLVTDGEQRASLAIVRSLGRSGAKPFVVSLSGRSLAGASRHAAGEARVPDALRDPGGFVASVCEQAMRWKIDVLLPVTEPSLLAILPERSRLPGISIPFPALEMFQQVSDKARLLATAPTAGIAIPWQCRVDSPGLRADLATRELPFPVVLKPSRSVGEAEGLRSKVGVEHASDMRELARRLDAFAPAAYPLLVQQRIVGPGVGVFLLLWEGRTVATFAHRRIREKPPSGGVSVYRESIVAPPDLVAKSVALLEKFHWQGVAMVEFKVDAATGTPFLMEINGRFWGSLQLAIDAGVDFPTLLVRLARGESVAPVTSYRLGVRSRWWWGDVDHLIARLRRSATALSLPPGSPGRGAALFDFLLLWRPGDHSEVFRISDPLPSWRETVEWFREL